MAAFTASLEGYLQDRPKFELLTRLGFAARGLVYVIVGLLVIRTGRAEDAAGVFEDLASSTGRWLMVAISAGFAGYGLWRIADALFAIECRGDDHEGIKRVAAGISGAIHLYLAKQASELVLGGRQLEEVQDQASNVLQLPGGQLLLGLVAAGLGAAGLFQLVTAARCSFLADLDHSVRDTWVKWLGRLGYAARGIVFLLAGYFVAGAALEDRASRAAGIEQVLEWLTSPMDVIVAGGLLMFGLYALVEARYRRIHAPDPEQIADQASARLGR